MRLASARDLPRSVGLELADLTVPGPQVLGEQLAVLVNDPQGHGTEFDGDGLAGVGEADLDALWLVRTSLRPRWRACGTPTAGHSRGRLRIRVIQCKSHDQRRAGARTYCAAVMGAQQLRRRR